MYLIVHVATGAAISTLIPEPLIAIPVAFASHFVLDAIPHWHDIPKGGKPTKTTIKIVTTDFALSIALAVLLIVQTENLYLLYGIVAASIMDSDVVLYPLCEKKKWRKLWPSAVSKLHGSIQNETKSYWGLVSQVIIIIFSLLIIKYA